MTLGQELRERRTALGRSIEQVSAATRIHGRILLALEEDRYADLPARAFTRGFIVNYAKALGLDAEALLKSHHDFLEQRFSERPDRDQGHQGYAFEGKELEQTRRWTWIGLSAAGIFALAVVLVFKPGNHKRKEKHKEFAAESTPSPGDLPPEASPALTLAGLDPSPSPGGLSPATPTATPAATPVSTPSPIPAAATPAPTPAPTATPEAGVSPTPNPDKLNKGDDLKPNEVKIRLVVQTESDIWVRYRADQRPIGMLILRGGKSVAVKARERILFESSPSAKLRYRLGGAGFKDSSVNRFEIQGAGGELQPYSGSELGRNPLSDEVPPPRAP